MPESRFEVYLAGPITGCNDDQKKRWRADFKREVNLLRNDVDFYDPELWSAAWRPLRETLQLRSADVVVANMWKESVGTTVGIMQAVDVGKPVVLIDPNYINSKVLGGITGESPARTVKEAAERLHAVLSDIHELTVVKTTGETVPFEMKKLVASIQTACGAAHVPEVLFAQQISARVLQVLRAKSRPSAPIPTTQIKDAIFEVLEDLSVNPVFEPQVHRDAMAVNAAWRKKEGYKLGDAGTEGLRAELAVAREDAAYYSALWKAASESRAVAEPVALAPAGGTAIPAHTSLESALNAAATKWSDSLIVLPSAHKSAREYKKWRNGDDALRLLNLLGQCAYERMVDKAERRIGQTADEWLRLHQDGFTAARNESSETMRRYRKEHTFAGPNGLKWECAKHLKIGAHGGAEKVLRIYFCEDADTRKIVIGHVGEHLPTYGEDG